MKFVLLLLAATALHFDIADQRGKHASGIAIEPSTPDADGWCNLIISKSKRPFLIVWPFDAKAKLPDGPEPVPAIVLDTSDTRPITDPKTIAALAAGQLLGNKPPVLFDAAALVSSQDPFAKGVGFLYAKKPADALDPLSRALRDRERQLTRVPSEIYAAAMLYGHALLGANKFDDAAVAFLKALNQRPFDADAHRLRAEALIKAGKPEAAGH